MTRAVDHRGHGRIDLEISGLPFVGYHAERIETFEYSLHDISDTGVQIRVRGGQDTGPMRENDTIDLFLALRSGDGEVFDRGRVKWARQAAPPGETVCGLLLLDASDCGESGEDEHSWRRLSLSLRSSNVLLEGSDHDSAGEVFSGILRDAARIKEEIGRALDRAEVRPDNRRSRERERLSQIKAEYEADAARMRPYDASARTRPEAGQIESPALTYEEICALLKPRHNRLGPFLADLAGGGKAFSDRITSLSLKLVARHNALVLLKMGYLAYTYQNHEDFCRTVY